MRVGIGFDAHTFDENRKLIIGGVEIPYKKGLKGHSDADVLIHAIMDSLLGADSKMDIGHYFPDNDEKYKGISSLELLMKVKDIITGKIGNIDTVIICQEPKLSGYMEKMKEKISETLEISINQISIKATTTEYMGFTGRGEGIAAISIVLMENN